MTAGTGKRTPDTAGPDTAEPDQAHPGLPPRPGGQGPHHHQSTPRGPGPSTTTATDVVLGRVGALDLDLLRAIVLVADVGSISRAAGVLGYSQPGLSQRLQVAERALGCRLFHRGPQGVKVTALGVVVLPYAKVLLSVAQTMVQAITHAQQGDR
jgi:Bacterial regulatory helix-turn-helix protein, lysR family